METTFGPLATISSACCTSFEKAWGFGTNCSILLSFTRWSEITKYLPRRAENTIKNHWFSTNRAKAKNKTNSFLYIYGTLANNNWTAASGSKLFKEAIKK